MVSGLVSTDDWLSAAKHRRTVYGLKGTSAVPDSRVENIVKEVLSFAPSSYNTQPVRITLVTGEKHKQFWDIVIAAAEPVLKGAGEQVWSTMSGIFQAHKGAYGSVCIPEGSTALIKWEDRDNLCPIYLSMLREHSWLIIDLQVVFWESQNSIKQAGEAHKSAAHMFAEFGDHATGMYQILVWTALELEGLGANLQHLNAIPPVEAALKEFLGVPEDYKLKAHLNYGDEAQEHPQPPQKLPYDETLKVVS